MSTVLSALTEKDTATRISLQQQEAPGVRFAQYRSRDDFFYSLGVEPDEITFDQEPVGRFNVAPGNKLLLLNEQEDSLRLDPFTGAMARKSGGISSRSSTRAAKRRRAAACLNLSEATAHCRVCRRLVRLA